MFRWVVRIVWLALGAVVAIWVYEGLTSVDQRESLVPFLSGNPETGIIFVGVAWGLISMLLSAVGLGRGGAGGGRALRTRVAMGEVIEIQRTGVTINDVPQYDVYLEVAPRDGDRFVAYLRGLFDPFTVTGVQPGAMVPVRYDPSHRDRVEMAAEGDAR
ncbi:hypothetical protein [Microbacterium halophytorum]|uniref:hypothetical protein n=1 Tax=Microbacterium halophytorum TaxID=2067568 RepID=UPI000CFE227D|nr:hypothetical protein [Microbacterium halophytorum]